jgi:hypothetical protein
MSVLSVSIHSNGAPLLLIPNEPAKFKHVLELTEAVALLFPPTAHTFRAPISKEVTAYIENLVFKKGVPILLIILAESSCSQFELEGIYM